MRVERDVPRCDGAERGAGPPVRVPGWDDRGRVRRRRWVQQLRRLELFEARHATGCGRRRVFAFLLSIGLAVWFLLRRRKRQNSSGFMMKTTSKRAPKHARHFRGEPVEDDFERGETGPRQFCYADLAAATGNFSDDRRLGRGGFGVRVRRPLDGHELLRGREEDVGDLSTGLEGVRRRGAHHQPAPAPQPRAAHWLVPRRRRRAPPRLRAHAQRQPRRPPVQQQQHHQAFSDVAGPVRRRGRRRRRAAVPARGRGAPRGAPRREAEQRDTGRGLRRQARRLRAGAAGRRRPAVPHDGRGGHVRVHGPGERAGRQGQRGVRRVQLRRPPPRARVRPAPGGARRRRELRAPGAVGVGRVRRRERARRRRRAARRRVRRQGGGVHDARRDVVRAPGPRTPADDTAGRQGAVVRGAAAELAREDAGCHVQAAGWLFWFRQRCVVVGCGRDGRRRHWAFHPDGDVGVAQSGVVHFKFDLVRFKMSAVVRVRPHSCVRLSRESINPSRFTEKDAAL